ncbi:hypothetical protein [Mesorhizobium sp. LCM 4577]|nr:hypothetical protein [Mesorhizobium sp. LCM 4577]
MLHHMLANPVYAGAYAFSRPGARVVIESQRVVRDSLPGTGMDGEV